MGGTAAPAPGTVTRDKGAGDGGVLANECEKKLFPRRKESSGRGDDRGVRWLQSPPSGISEGGAKRGRTEVRPDARPDGRPAPAWRTRTDCRAAPGHGDDDIVFTGMGWPVTEDPVEGPCLLELVGEEPLPLTRGGPKPGAAGIRMCIMVMINEIGARSPARNVGWEFARS